MRAWGALAALLGALVLLGASSRPAAAVTIRVSFPDGALCLRDGCVSPRPAATVCSASRCVMPVRFVRVPRPLRVVVRGAGPRGSWLIPVGNSTRRLVFSPSARGIVLRVTDRGRPLTGVSDVAVTDGGTVCALRGTGRVVCWGRALGTRAAELSAPTEVAGLTGVVRIAAGADHVCALDRAGTVRCAGGNLYGELGDGTRRRRTRPAPVVGLGAARDISAAGYSTCAVRADGTAACWGYGHPSSVGISTRPRPLPDVAGATRIAAGATQCAVVAGGRVICRGARYLGALGDGSTWRVGDPEDRREVATPVPVSGVTDAVRISSGANTCVVRRGGALVCWGQIVNQPDALASSVPVPVPGLGGVRATAAGDFHRCAVRTDRTVVCWGQNGEKQLGDGTVVPRWDPRPVPGVRGAVAVDAATKNTCAVVTGGRVLCWGDNARRQLGDGTTRDRRRAVLVTG